MPGSLLRVARKSVASSGVAYNSSLSFCISLYTLGAPITQAHGRNNRTKWNEPIQSLKTVKRICFTCVFVFEWGQRGLEPSAFAMATCLITHDSVHPYRYNASSYSTLDGRCGALAVVHPVYKKKSPCSFRRCHKRPPSWSIWIS